MATSISSLLILKTTRSPNFKMGIRSADATETRTFPIHLDLVPRALSPFPEPTPRLPNQH